MNPNEFINNVNAWTLEQFAPYEGKFVAWSEDGKAILAAGASHDELFAEVDRRGIKEYIIGYVPTQEEVMGGFR